VTKFASIRIWNRSARSSDQLRAQKVLRNVVQLRFGHTIPGKQNCRIGTVDAL
jgi:hypothetical protein